MELYTERHGMRTPIERTYSIDLDMYSLLFKCCEKYYDNIAWKFPSECPDGRGCCGMDKQQMNTALKFRIPSLYRDEYGTICVPEKSNYGYGDAPEYDQYALLDLIEFIGGSMKDIEIGDFHPFFGHSHLTCKDTNSIFYQFQEEINNIFKMTGLLYHLNNKKIVERVILNSPLSTQIESELAAIKEKGTRELLSDAIALYKTPNPAARQDSVEKIWDALERLKTYYTSMDKKQSVTKIITDMANNQTEFVDLFNNEFKTLTDLGNKFRIRHHETDKIDITDSRHYDYFFNICLSLIALAIQYLH